MKETTIQIAKKHVTDEDMWYVDSHDSYAEVGISNREDMENFMNHLERQGIYHEMMSAEELRVYE